MANHVYRPSLFQPRHSHHSDSLLPSTSISAISHPLRSVVHFEPHRHAHHPLAHDHQPRSDDINDSATAPTTTVAADLAEPAHTHADVSYVTHVVQTISLIQMIDLSGSLISMQTQYAQPEIVVIDPSSGKTVSHSKPGLATIIEPSNLSPRLDSLLLFTPSPTSHNDVTLTASPSGLSDSSNSPSVSAGIPLLPVANNGTLWGNATQLGTFNSTANPSTSKPSGILMASSTNQVLDMLSNSSWSRLSSTLSTSSSSSTSSPSSFTYISSSTKNPPAVIPTGVGSAETRSAATSPGELLTPQQKEVVGGVVGGVAGVAFLALVVMLVLRYKRKRVKNQSLPLDRQPQAIGAQGTSASHATNSMVERNAAAASVAAAFADLTRKRQSRSAEHGAENLLRVPVGGEQGFYRVSGRKLPSVLYSGGDGYSDPRASTISQHSETWEPFNRDSRPFALGTPMRPVSGIPVMRCGPARTAVTEGNPFEDPVSSPPFPHSNPSGPRRPDSNSSSQQALGSRFQESI